MLDVWGGRHVILKEALAPSCLLNYLRPLDGRGGFLLGYVNEKHKERVLMQAKNPLGTTILFFVLANIDVLGGRGGSETGRYL